MDSFGIASLIICLSLCLSFHPWQQPLADSSPPGISNPVIPNPSASDTGSSSSSSSSTDSSGNAASDTNSSNPAASGTEPSNVASTDTELSKQEETAKQELARQQETYQMLLQGKLPDTASAVYQKAEQPTVYLTFDDGPSKLTGTVLDILQEEQIKATFFMLGDQAESYPDMVKRVVKEGHAIGNHSYNHVYKELYSDYSVFWQQIRKNEDILFKLSGFYTRLLRAPGGTSTNFDAFYFYYLKQAGYVVVDWNVDSGDSARRNVPASEIIQNVKKATLRHEMNVLIHDGSGHYTSVQALKEIIHYFKDNGYTFKPLTPEVKPIQFPVVAIKWKRSVSFEGFQESESAARANASIFSHPQTLSE